MSAVQLDVRAALSAEALPDAPWSTASRLAWGPDEHGHPLAWVDDADALEWKALDVARHLQLIRLLGRRAPDGLRLLATVYGPAEVVPEEVLTEGLRLWTRAYEPADRPLTTPLVVLDRALPRHMLAARLSGDGVSLARVPDLHDAVDAGPDRLAVRHGEALHALDDAGFMALVDRLLAGQPAVLGDPIPVPDGTLTTLARGRIGVVRSHGWLHPLDLPSGDAPTGPLFLAPGTWAAGLPDDPDHALAVTAFDGLIRRQRLPVTPAVAALLSPAESP